MLFQCPKCQQIDFDYYCSNCEIDKVQYATADEIVITISDFSDPAHWCKRRSVPNSLSHQNSNTSYQLKPDELSVPVEQLKSFLEDTEPHAVSMRGALIHAKTDEQKVWSGKPNLFVVILIFFKWLPTIILTFVFLTILKLGYIWGIILLFYAVVDVALNSLAIGFINYRLSTQRLEITDGLLHQQIRTYEVHHLCDATIDIPFPLGFFGLSMLKIRHRSGKSENNLPLVRIFHPPPNSQISSHISIIGIPKEEARLVRDIIRNSGQIEGSRVDKFRVRND